MKPSNQYVSFAYMVLNPAAMLKDKERVIKISFSEEIFLVFMKKIFEIEYLYRVPLGKLKLCMFENHAPMNFSRYKLIVELGTVWVLLRLRNMACSVS